MDGDLYRVRVNHPRACNGSDFGCLHASNGKVVRCCSGRFRVFFSDDKGAASALAIELKRAAHEMRAIPSDPVEVG